MVGAGKIARDGPIPVLDACDEPILAERNWARACIASKMQRLDATAADPTSRPRNSCEALGVCNSHRPAHFVDRSGAARNVTVTVSVSSSPSGDGTPVTQNGTGGAGVVGGGVAKNCGMLGNAAVDSMSVASMDPVSAVSIAPCCGDCGSESHRTDSRNAKIRVPTDEVQYVL